VNKPTPRGDLHLSTPADLGSPFSGRYRTVTVAMVALVALGAFEALAVTTTMPTVVAALGGLGLYAMAFAGPLASGVVGMVAAGGWTDRRGPAGSLYAGVGLFVAGLVVAGTASTMAVVVTGRVVQGLGSGMFGVALYVVVARVYPDSLQPRVLAAFSAAWVLPAVVGPAIAGTVAERLGWRWVFLAVPLLAVPAVLLMRPALATTTTTDRRPTGPTSSPTSSPTATPSSSRVRLLRAVGAASGLLMLQVGGQADGVQAVLLVAAGLALLGSTVRGLLPRGTLRVARGLPAVLVVRGMLAAAFFAAEVYLPLLLTTERRLSPTQAGVALTAGALTWSLGSWLRSRFEGRWPDRGILLVGAGAIAVGITLAALGLWPAFPVVATIAGWGAAGLGMGLAYPTLSLLVLRLSAPSEQGGNTAALQLVESLSIALALAVSGSVFALLVADRPTTAFLACFGAAGLLALLGATACARVPYRVAVADG
jgi:MFS family permease